MVEQKFSQTLETNLYDVRTVMRHVDLLCPLVIPGTMRYTIHICRMYIWYLLMLEWYYFSFLGHSEVKDNIHVKYLVSLKERCIENFFFFFYTICLGLQ